MFLTCIHTQMGILLFIVTQESKITEAPSWCIYPRLLKEEEGIWGITYQLLKLPFKSEIRHFCWSKQVHMLMLTFKGNKEVKCYNAWKYMMININVTHRESVTQNLKRFYDLSEPGIGNTQNVTTFRIVAMWVFCLFCFRNNTL